MHASAPVQPPPFPHRCTVLRPLEQVINGVAHKPAPLPQPAQREPCATHQQVAPCSWPQRSSAVSRILWVVRVCVYDDLRAGIIHHTEPPHLSNTAEGSLTHWNSITCLSHACFTQQEAPHLRHTAELLAQMLPHDPFAVGRQHLQDRDDGGARLLIPEKHR